ncbi:hypothetical protein KPH14_001596 [Odynerus spinipes]|uniref:Charged multivesicular body protein 7 n=1 Tax=Odynerus spinipes TaxID=1348599 RepID=A0AAD9VVN3_9HYME|nr:hypothetical protein KPH14_001596 [Odynerus spinipes]
MLEKSEVNANLPLPPEKMPDCWNQDDRMNALFSPFRSKSANQQDWISKYKFWNDIIHAWLRHTKQCTFSLFDLNEIFKRKGCSPLCLTTVVEEMLRNKEIVSEEEFLKETNDSWTAWSLNIFIKKPLTWSYCKVKDYVVGQNVNICTSYVHLKAVKEIAEFIHSTIRNESEYILISTSEILEKCKEKESHSGITENTLKLALTWLKHHKKAAFRKSSTSDELLVKFSVQEVHNISELEEALYKLSNQENKLEREIELLEKEKVAIMDKAKVYLTKELQQAAKSHLRKKIELEKTIEKRAKTLANLRALILSIQDTHSNTGVLDAYKIGSNILMQFEEKGLTEHEVRDVMDDVNEALTNYRDVQSTLTETLPSIDFESDSDLEKELSELINEDDVCNSKVNTTSEKMELEDLEQRLKNLGVKGLPSPEKSLQKTSTPLQKKKVLVQSEDI